MADKKQIYEADVVDLPFFRMVMADIPVSVPVTQHPTCLQIQKVDPDLEDTVKRLIAHFKETDNRQ